MNDAQVRKQMLENSKRAKGMKRRRADSSTSQDHEGDRRMSDGVDDVVMCRDVIDDDDEPVRKRAMVIKANLRFLEKIPPLRDYQRLRNGRRGAIDGGNLTGAIMMAALEESFEETSFVTNEPPSRAAMVAPAPASFQVPSSRQVGREDMSPTRDPPRGRSPVSRDVVRPTLSSAKDDEARPASE